MKQLLAPVHSERLSDVKATILYLHPGDTVFEICTFNQFGKPLAGWFRDKNRAAAEVKRISANASIKATYITLNPCHDALLSRNNERISPVKNRTSDNDILALIHLLIDVDPKRPSDTNSSDEEHEAALEQGRVIMSDLKADGWPDPLYSDSGNGANLIYALPGLPNSKDNVDLLKSCLKALAQKYDTDSLSVDQSVFNPGRITKVAGTMTRKGQEIPGRPQRLSKIISMPETKTPVDISLLKALAGTVQTVAKKSDQASDSRLDVKAYLDNYGFEILREKEHGDSTMYCLRHCVIEPAHGPNEAAIVQQSNGMLSYQCFHNSCKGKTWHDAKVAISGTDSLRQFMTGDMAEEKKTVSVGKSNKSNDNEEKVTVVDEVNDFDRELISVTPYPLHVFPTDLIKVVDSVSESFAVQLSLVAGIMLSIVSGALGNTIRVSPKETYEVILFIWLMVIGKTGYCKTPPMDFLLRPVKARQKIYSDENARKTRAYLRQLKQSRNDNEAEIPDKPKLMHCMVSDITVESLADVFYGDSRGVVSYQDELSGFMLGMDQYKARGNDLQRYLDVFYGSPWKIDRRSESKYISNTGINLIGGIQSDIVPRIFEATTIKSGLFPRFITENISAAPGHFKRKGVPMDIVNTWAELINECYAQPILYDNSGFIAPRILRMEEDALDVWIKFHDEWAEYIPYMSNRLSPFIEKLKGYYSLKFAGILHALKCLLKGKQPEGLIDAETVSGAIDITRYYAGQARMTLNLYDETAALSEFQLRLITVLYDLQHEIEKGRLLFARIVAQFNAGLSEKLQHTSERIGHMIKGLGLKTEKGTRGAMYLICEEKKLRILYLRKTSTTSTTSTKTIQRVDEVDEVDVIPNSKKQDDGSDNGGFRLNTVERVQHP